MDEEIIIKEERISAEEYIEFLIYEKLGMKHADEVMKYNHIDWTEWTVE